jgi:type II secretory pathway pseudopilin PulG
MRYTTHKGMTFIELTVWMGLIAIVAGSIITMTVFFYRRDRDLLAEAQGSQSVRKTVDKIVKDLREATFGHNGAFVIEAMSAYTLTFYTDADRDDATERVRYYVTGTDFRRGVVNPTGNPPTYPSGSEVVTMISNSIMNQTNSVPMFTYYDSAGAAISTMTETGRVAYVEVRVLVNRAPVGFTPRITEVKGSVSLRNPPSI